MPNRRHNKTRLGCVGRARLGQDTRKTRKTLARTRKAAGVGRKGQELEELEGEGVQVLRKLSPCCAVNKAKDRSQEGVEGEGAAIQGNCNPTDS